MEQQTQSKAPPSAHDAARVIGQVAKSWMPRVGVKVVVDYLVSAHQCPRSVARQAIDAAADAGLIELDGDIAIPAQGCATRVPHGLGEFDEHQHAPRMTGEPHGRTSRVLTTATLIGLIVLWLVACAPLPEPVIRPADPVVPATAGDMMDLFAGQGGVGVDGVAAAAALPAYASPDFEDLGPLTTADGQPLQLSDPWIGKEDGAYWLFYTWGPTDPTKPGGSSPGIYRRRAASIRGPYGPPTIVLKPTDTPAFPLDRGGNETFTACRSPRGGWVGLIHVYPWLGTSGKGVPAFFRGQADKLGGTWTKSGPVTSGQYAWELPWLGLAEGGTGEPKLVHRGTGMSEPSIQPLGSLLVALFSAEAKLTGDGTAWRTGLMVSWDDGYSWLHHPVPLFVPPAVYEDASGINSISHVALLADPRGGWHAFTTWEGRMSGDQKGIAHWFSLDMATWERTPTLAITAGQRVGSVGHVGGPAPIWEDGELLLVYHSDGDPAFPRRHARLARVKR